MGQTLRLPTHNPLFLVPFGYGLGAIVYQLWESFRPLRYYPWEFRYRDAIEEGRIPSGVTLEEFRQKYDDYGHTIYSSDLENERPR